VPGRGYATYRVKDRFRDNLPDGEVRVGELVATDPEAEAALWQHVCDIDLTTTVRSWLRPPDDALPELLVDRLRARTSVSAPLYVRLLDVAAAFSARTYAATDTLTFAVHDADRDQSGTYRLDGGPGGGAGRPGRRPRGPDAAGGRRGVGVARGRAGHPAAGRAPAGGAHHGRRGSPRVERLQEGRARRIEPGGRRRRDPRAISKASETLRNLDWFEVKEIRGWIQDGEVQHTQVTLQVGFRLDD
jgi:hypothetical protein